MTWQKEGTEYSEGSLGSDYKHFKRKENDESFLNRCV